MNSVSVATKNSRMQQNLSGALDEDKAGACSQLPLMLLGEGLSSGANLYDSFCMSGMEENDVAIME